jgi:hypothetical protein
LDVIRAGIDHVERKLFFVDSFDGNFKNRFALKNKLERARDADRAVTFVKVIFDIGDRARGIVGGCFDKDGHAMRAIAFVIDLFITGAVGSLAFFNRFFDQIPRNVKFLAPFHGNPQKKVVPHIGFSLLEAIKTSLRVFV